MECQPSVVLRRPASLPREFLGVALDSWPRPSGGSRGGTGPLTSPPLHFFIDLYSLLPESASARVQGQNYTLLAAVTIFNGRNGVFLLPLKVLGICKALGGIFLPCGYF
jgi:hypothetical protein